MTATQILHFLPLAGLGCFAGLLAGLLGIGGGLMLVPILTFFLLNSGAPPEHVVHAAIGTSLGVIAVTSISSGMAHYRSGAVRWDIAKGMAPGLVVGSLIGSTIASALPTRELALVFGGFVIFSAYQMWVDKKPKPSRQLPSTVGLAGVASFIGAASAIVGAGGGFLSVPYMIWSNVHLRQAVATSSVMGFPIALFASTGYVINGLRMAEMPDGYLGFLHLPAILTIGSMSIFFAPFGAKLAHSMPVKLIKKIFAFLLTSIAVSMIYKAFGGF